MPLLSSSIVKHQLATVEQVEEALARQSAYGGDLLTNLLEVAPLSEGRVADALSESFGLEAAPVGELPRAPEHVRRLVPADVAERFACHPLEELAGTLVLAVSEPLPAEVESDLGFALGVTVTQRVASLVRVRQAVSRDYGLKLDPRVARALARLEGRSDPSPSFRPEPEAPIAERPDTVAPPPRPPTAVPAPEPAPARPQHSASTMKALVRAARPEPPRARRLGPYTAAMAERDLLDASSRDDALRAFFDFTIQYFEYAALFAVHADLAEGRDAHGPGASRAKVQSIGVPLDLPSSLSAVRDAQGHELVRLGGGGLDAALAKDLERKPGPLALLLPIRVRGRTILILYGDHGEQDVDLYAIGDVISFAPHVASALERLIVQKKRGRGEQRVLASLAPPPRARQPLPGPEERAHALVSVLSAKPSRGPHATFSEPPPAPSEPPADREKSPDSSPKVAEPDGSDPPEPIVSNVPEAAALAETPSRAPYGARPLAPALGSDRPRSSAPPRSIAEALARPVIPIGQRPSERPTDPPPPGGIPGHRFASVPPSLVDRGWEDLAAGRGPYGSREGGTAPGVGFARRSPDSEDTPVISIGTVVEEDALPTESEEGVPLAPGSRSAAHSARPLPARASTQGDALPSVIVDRAADCRLLVDQLIAGDPKALENLLAAGTPAVSALVGAFPGPIEPPSSRRGTGLARASESGPVLKALARIGTPAVPFLVVRTHDADASTRAFATRLLGEIPSTESARAISRRFYDGDIEVRRAALTGARLLATSADTMSVLVAELGITAEDRMKPTGVRLTAMEVLAELRHAQGVPYLILVLEDNPVDLVQAARRALVILARNDLGASAGSWSEWWRANSGRHRIEWLIDALTHESRDIRRAAGEELKALTREYFGYYDDLPPADRRQAQEQYRDWWESRGKARFRP